MQQLFDSCVRRALVMAMLLDVDDRVLSFNIMSSGSAESGIESLSGLVSMETSSMPHEERQSMLDNMV